MLFSGVLFLFFYFLSVSLFFFFFRSFNFHNFTLINRNSSIVSHLTAVSFLLEGGKDPKTESRKLKQQTPKTDSRLNSFAFWYRCDEVNHGEFWGEEWFWFVFNCENTFLLNRSSTPHCHKKECMTNWFMRDRHICSGLTLHLASLVRFITTESSLKPFFFAS